LFLDLLDGKNGILSDDFSEDMKRLAGEDNLREKLGKNAKISVERYLVKNNIKKIEKQLASLS
jgi:hypothetical protein